MMQRIRLSLPRRSRAAIYHSPINGGVLDQYMSGTPTTQELSHNLRYS
jgi:hypothetical protein